MAKYIIDTNVPLKAASLHPADELDRRCSEACLAFIRRFMRDGTLVLDAGGEILREYRNNFSSSGQDSVATAFLLWVCRGLTLRAGGGARAGVELCPLERTAEGGYAAYPASPLLAGFDPSDRKFIALSRAHPGHPPIAEGADSLWWGYREAFAEAGVQVRFLCEEYVRAKYEEKHHG